MTLLDLPSHSALPVLTRDNCLLPRPTAPELTTVATNAEQLSPAVREYLKGTVSENTRRAYRYDLQHFIDWGGTLPATDVMVANYIAEHAGTLAVATLARRVASISKAHAMKGFPNSTQSELVKATMRGIRRAHGKPQRRARPLVKEELFTVLAAMGDNLRDTRDKALLLVGFAGGFRRSELVAINCNDIERVRQGIVVHVRRSKTDQEGVGRRVCIPFGHTRWCPIAALDFWLAGSGIEYGPVFRRVDRHVNVVERLSGEAVSLIIKERVAAVGFDPEGYSGHSLRAGLATSAAAAGASSWKIRQQTGHASDAMLRRYIRDGELFVDNAVGALL